MNAYEVLVKPIITERATGLSDRMNKFTFQVHPRANKHQVRDAVESMYGVRVAKVATLSVPGKLKRRGASIGRRSDWKKAIVTLEDGESIDVMGGV